MRIQIRGFHGVHFEVSLWSTISYENLKEKKHWLRPGPASFDKNFDLLSSYLFESLWIPSQVSPVKENLSSSVEKIPKVDSQEVHYLINWTTM